MILVENRESDGPFVERVVKEIDNRQLGKLWERGGAPIRFDSVGGAGQMRQEVERRAGAVPYRPRLVAVVDSDKKGPGTTANESARRLRQICEDRSLPCWVLAKREAETTCRGFSSTRDATPAPSTEGGSTRGTDSAMNRRTSST